MNKYNGTEWGTPRSRRRFLQRTAGLCVGSVALDKSGQEVARQTNAAPVVQDEPVLYRIEYGHQIEDDGEDAVKLHVDITEIHESWLDVDLFYSSHLTLVDSENVPWSEGDTEMQATFKFDNSVSDDPERAHTSEWLFDFIPKIKLNGTRDSTGDLPTVHELNDGAMSGGNWIYLGVHEEYTRTTNNETIRLVVPSHVSVNPEKILDILTVASDQFAVDGHASGTNMFGRDSDVTCYALSDPIRTGGRAVGNSFWVHEDSESTWVHEYVHTRQTYHRAESTEWTLEGIAEYYEAQLPWRFDFSNYPRVRKNIKRGLDHDAVLADPSTWQNRTEYEKGSLVVAALDAKIQQATSGQESFETVLRQLNNQDSSTAVIDGEKLQTIAEYVAGTNLDSFFDAYIRGEQLPAVPGHDDFPAIDSDIQWSFETEHSLPASPTVVSDTVFIGSSDNYVRALDAQTGDKQWVFETGGSIESSPTVVDDSLFVGGNDGNVYALDAQTGDKHWVFETGDRIESSPTVVYDTLFVGSWDGYVYALDTQTGDERWTFETASRVSSSPTVVDGSLFVGSNDSNVYALDTQTGGERWAFETGGRVHSSPTVADGTMFVGSNDSNVYALDAQTGDKQWAVETGGRIQSSPTVIDNTLFVGSWDGYVYALDAQTGDERWTSDIGGRTQSSPTVADGTVFVGGDDESVYALDAQTGDKQWAVETAGLVASSPTVVDGSLFVGSDDSYVYALETPVEGSSEGSRVTLGTLGHHQVWANNHSKQHLPPIVGEEPPRNLDGDGNYEDVNGDGEFTIADVQAFFEHYRTDVVQDNAEFFSFSDANHEDVTLDDVQALYQLLVGD